MSSVEARGEVEPGRPSAFDIVVLAALFGLVWLVLSRLVGQAFELPDLAGARASLLRSIVALVLIGVGGAALLGRWRDLNLPWFDTTPLSQFDLAVLALTLGGLALGAGFHVTAIDASADLPLGIETGAMAWWLVLATGYAGAGLVLVARSRIAGLTVLAGRLASPDSRPGRRVAIKRGRNVRYVRIEDIESARAEDNYVALAAGGRSELWRGSLKAFVDTHAPEFLQVHRGIAVNPRHVERLNRSGGSAVLVLESGAEIRVAVRQARSVAEALER